MSKRDGLPGMQNWSDVYKRQDLADTLRSAFRIACSGRPGPVLVDVPKDITSALAEYTPAEKVQPDPAPSAFDLEQAAALINSAKRPVVYFGGGVRISDAGEQLRQLVKKADIPAVHTMMAAGVLGYGERESFGLLGMHGCITANRAVGFADVVIAIGARFSDRVALNPEKFAQKAKVIHIDIDSSEIGKNVATDISIVGDVKEVLTQLLPMIQPAQHTEWFEQLQQWQKQDYHPQDDASVLKPHQVIASICDQAGPDAIYVTDVGQHQMWAAQYLRHVHPKNFLTSGGLGTMGYGYGAAIGAQIANPGRRVIHITGDGSFHMNMNEACTAVSYGLPIVTVIMNNAVLGMVRQWQDAFYGRRFSSSEPERKTDYVKVAEGFGAKGYRCENLAQFESVLSQALQQTGPVWIDCRIDREERVLPMIPAGKTVQDAIF